MNKPQTIEKCKTSTVYARKTLGHAFFVAVDDISAGDQEQHSTSKRQRRPANIGRHSDRHFVYHRNDNQFHNDDEC